MVTPPPRPAGDPVLKRLPAQGRRTRNMGYSTPLSRMPERVQRCQVQIRGRRCFGVLSLETIISKTASCEDAGHDSELTDR